MPRPPSPRLGLPPKGYRRASLPAVPSPTFPLTNTSIPRPIRRPRKILYLVVIFFLLYWFGIRHGLGIERTPPPPLGFAVQGGRRGRKSSLTWGDTGIAELAPPRAGVTPEHPIYELMERAEASWHGLLASQSGTLQSAVAEYKKRYKLLPPKGFDKWFRFCQLNNVRIIDDYDQLMKDILPHHALPPATFLERSKALDGSPFSFTLDIRKDRVELSGDRSSSARPKHLKIMILGFRESLPDDFRLVVTGSDHDTGSTILGNDQRQRAMELVSQGEYFDEAELKLLEDPNRTPAFGWFKACPLDSPANIRPGAENATHEILPKSFIYDHIPTMDFCDFPELKRLHGAMSVDFKDRSPSKLKPIMVLSKFLGDSSFLATPLEAYLNNSAADIPYLGTWEEKTDNRLFWRGSTTGGFNTQRDWKESHRMRLHLMVNGPKGGDRWWDQQTRDVIIPDGQGSYKQVRRWEKALSGAYADVKLSGKPVQCATQNLCNQIADTIEFGEKVWPDQAITYKYLLDVDSNGWSSRFHRLLSSASPVIKFTMFAEWHMEWLTPWYHYIPLKADYSDLYDTMAFFVGSADDNGRVDETKGHDHLARKIGEAGQRFALEHWRWVDMQAYTLRLLLELQRLHSLDRDGMSYHEFSIKPPGS